MKNGKLNGKVAVITGASKGIGAGIAKEFAAEGAAVVVNYASAKQDADRVVDEKQSPFKATSRRRQMSSGYSLKWRRPSAKLTSWSITPASMSSYLRTSH
jgi:NAD(P)-dependent dehydrogenase (short-subunit alcohol dehydrogenase family)